MRLAQSSVLTNATIGGSGGQIASSYGTFDHVTLARDLVVGDNSTVIFRNGLTLTGGTLTLSAANNFNNTQTIGGTGTIALTGDSTFPELYANDGVLTIGAGITVVGGGTIHDYGGAHIVNNGTIRADSISFGNESAVADINNGLMEATLNHSLGLGRIDNTNGTIRAAGGHVSIGFVKGTQLGSIQATGGGSFTLGNVDNTNYTLTADATTGSIELGAATGGTLATADGTEFFAIGCSLTNTTLSGHFSARPGSYGASLSADHLNLNGGIISLYGKTTGSAIMSVKTTGPLTGTGEIVFEGTGDDNAVNGDGGRITLPSGITIRTGSAGGRLGVVDNRGTISAQTSGHSIQLSQVNNLAGGTISASNGSSVTFDNSSTTNHGTISSTGSGAVTFALSTWMSDGTITADGGGTLNLGGTGTNNGSITVTDSTLNLSGSWTSPGAITATNSTVNLGGTFSFPTTLSRTGGTVSIVGTLQNTSAAMTLNAATGSWLLGTGGKILGGTINTADGAELIGSGGTIDSADLLGTAHAGAGGMLTLSNVTNHGTVRADAGGTVTFTGGTNAGTISGTGGANVTLGGTWSNTGTISVSDSTLALNGTSGALGSISVTKTATSFAGTFPAQQVAAVAHMNSSLTQTGGTIDNTGGTFDAGPSFPLAFAGGTLKGGTLTATGGAATVPSAAGPTFDGVIVNADVNLATGSTLTLAGSSVNNGTIHMHGATLALGNGFAAAGLGATDRDAASLVAITGSVNNTGGTLTIDPVGTWRVGFGTLSGGTVSSTDGAAVLNLFYGTLSGVTLDTAAYVAPNASGTITNGLTLNSPLTLDGWLTFQGTQTLSGSGTVILGTSFTGGFDTSSGATLTIAPGVTVRSGTIGGTVGGTVLNQGLVSSSTAGKSITFTGTVTNTGTVQAVNGGRLSTTGAFTNSGTISVGAGSTYAATGPLTWSGGSIGGDGAVITSNLNITGNVTKPATGALRVAGTFTLAAGNKLDLTTGKMIFTKVAAGTWDGSAYSGAQGLVQAGRNGGAWDGAGIVTSAAGANDYTTLGVATAAQVKGITGTATVTWAGQTVHAGDALVMFTYGGDANLDGQIDIDDYSQIDGSASVGGALKGWFNGDFNYDGNVDIDDYTIIDSNIGIQGAPFPTATGISSSAAIYGVTAVPEPAAAASACVAVMCAAQVGRRRRSARSLRR